MEESKKALSAAKREDIYRIQEIFNRIVREFAVFSSHEKSVKSVS